ncbi:MAG: hypothetical protein P8Y24_04340 [Gammaproteobacteria bacterium]|jgi:hypothetical protein
MKYFIYLFLVSTISPVMAETNANDYSYVLDIVESLKVIIHKEKDKKASRTELSRITGAKPLMKDNQYQGHQVIHDRELNGFIGIDFRDNKPLIAVYSSPPLRVRKATRRYKEFRSLLLKRYKEREYNLFDLGDQVTARLKKQARKVSIEVSRKR